MGLFKRVRQGVTGLASGLSVLSGQQDELQINAELPAGAHGSLFKLQLSLCTEPHGDGERMRLKAHVQSNFASVLRPMLEAPVERGRPALTTDQDRPRSLVRPVVGRLAIQGARRALRNRVLRRVADPLLHLDTNSYLEVVTSSASLDGGAFELMPRNEKLDALGVRPTRHREPHVETWSGVLPDGNAQIAAIQIEKDSLPDRLKKQLGDQPFNLAAMIVSTVQEK